MTARGKESSRETRNGKDSEKKKEGRQDGITGALQEQLLARAMIDNVGNKNGLLYHYVELHLKHSSASNDSYLQVLFRMSLFLFSQKRFT